MATSQHYEIVDLSDERATQVKFKSASEAAEHLMMLGIMGVDVRHLSVALITERVDRIVRCYAAPLDASSRGFATVHARRQGGV